MKIKVRFAPSPTGLLHLGNLRSALINYVFAKKNKGDFLIRIEDTDRARSKQEYVDRILNTLEQLGIKHDGSLIYQSQRNEIYKSIAEGLLEKKLAYKAKNEDGTFAIILKVDKARKMSFTDSIRGEISHNTDDLKDIVLIKSDGSATYMFAVVVDDNDMGITHVIRGDDHLINTFKQNYIYEAMGWSQPKYTHLPMILSQDGKKLSKRKDSVTVEEYFHQGFMPQAIVNYLLMLGWSYERAQRNKGGELSEIFSIEEAIDLFELKDLRKSAAKFDRIKLLDINNEYFNIKNFKGYINSEVVLSVFNKCKSSEIISNHIEKSNEHNTNKTDNVDFVQNQTGDFNKNFHKNSCDGFKNPDHELSEKTSVSFIKKLNKIIENTNACKILDEVLQRSRTFIEFIDYFKRFIEFDEDYLNSQGEIFTFLNKNFNIKSVSEKVELSNFNLYVKELKNLDIWSASDILDFTRLFCKDKSIKLKDLMHYIRVNAFKTKISPSLFVSMEYFGKEKSIQILKNL